MVSANINRNAAILAEVKDLKGQKSPVNESIMAVLGSTRFL